jgi:hypothetical protein
MRRIAWAALVASCGPSITELELDLDLAPGCETTVPSIALISVEVYGTDATGGTCAIARRCIDLVAPQQTFDDLTAAIRDVRQPLIDVPDRDILQVTITGHTTHDCFAFDDRALCGFADLLAATGDRLPITLACSSCPMQEFALCP